MRSRDSFNTHKDFEFMPEMVFFKAKVQVLIS